LFFTPTKKRGEKFSILFLRIIIIRIIRRRRRRRTLENEKEALRAFLCVLNINVLTDGQFYSSSSSSFLPPPTKLFRPAT
jgi:hypothetical protein